MPDFLVIGAAKAGTTAFYWYLRQHPDVFMPEVKEPHYFAFAGQRLAFKGPGVGLNRAITDRATYERLFEAGAGRRAIGEASASSLYVPEAPERIRREAPEARLIAILRQPADRAFSSYLHLKRDGREPAAGFAEALALEPQRIRDDWGFLWRYRDVGYYGRQLERYYALFPRERIRIYLHEDLRRDTPGVVRDAYAFIGVDQAFVPDTSVQFNPGGIPRSSLLGAAIGFRSPLRWLARRALPPIVLQRLKSQVGRQALARPRLDPLLRARLTDEFAEDIRLLASLIGRDLSHWLAARSDAVA